MKAPPTFSAGRNFGGGDRAVFYCTVELRPEPEDAFASEGDAFSWGSLEWWAGGKNLCAHYEGTNLVPNVSWYLLPFFEWLAGNWDYLFHEQRPPVDYDGGNGWESLQASSLPYRFARLSDRDALAAEEENHAWSCRHRLWSCREGGLFPDIVMRRDRDQIEVSWGSEPPAGAPADFRFVNSADAVRLPPENVAAVLYDILREATGFLRTVLPASARVRQLEKRVQNLARPIHREKWLSIMAGLGTKLNQWLPNFRRLHDQLASLPGAFESWFGGEVKKYPVLTGSCEGALMFGTAAPTLQRSDVFALAEHLVRDSSREKLPSGLAQHAADKPIESKPYLSGYLLASLWGEESGLWANSHGAIDIEAHLAGFGVKVADLTLGDQNIGGVAASRTDFNPLILVNTSNPRNKYPSGRRFTLAHELCHLLYDCGLGHAVALISGPWAPPEIEQRANAFAAMLLMPDDLVERTFQEIGANIRQANLDEVIKASKTLRVSPDALVHQLENRRWISHSQRLKIESDRLGIPEYFQGY